MLHDTIEKVRLGYLAIPQGKERITIMMSQAHDFFRSYMDSVRFFTEARNTDFVLSMLTEKHIACIEEECIGNKLVFRTIYAEDIAEACMMAGWQYGIDYDDKAIATQKMWVIYPVA